jgi:hypothetical protein
VTRVDRPVGTPPSVTERLAVERNEDEADDEQNRLVDRPRDRKEAKCGEAAERPRNPAVQDEDPDGEDEVARLTDHGRRVRPLEHGRRST